MTAPADSYGRRLTALASMQERLELERAEDRSQFPAVDALIEQALVRALRGERIIALGERYDDETITLLGDVDDALVKATYDVDAMEARGAWGLPDRASVAAGDVNFAWWMAQEPRYISPLADDEGRTVTLRGNPNAVFAWSALGPVFELLLIPYTLRSAQAGKALPEDQAKQWTKLDALLDATGLDLQQELAVFRPRSGWSRLSSDEIVGARQALVAGWSRNATPEMAARLRMYSQSQLIDRFYAKAKNTTPTARQTLTKAHWRPLVAHFAGDWLALLRYLGEEPSPNEQVITTLPEPKIYVGAEERAREAALAAGVDEAEVQRMLSSFFGGNQPTSPVDRRVAALKRLWEAVDAAHVAQTSGGRSLWGLLDERGKPEEQPWGGYTAGLWREELPADLNTEIRELWGTQATTKAPDRVITRLLPHAGAAQAFGPALDFWHQISLAALANAEALPNIVSALVDAYTNDYYKPLLQSMAAAGCPVDRAFFSELNDAARAMEEIQPPKRPGREIEVAEGLSFTISIEVSGSRPLKKRGFERVRDVITDHRRAWAQQYLDAYLRARWQADLRAAAETYNRAVTAKGKPPTIRQTIKACERAINLWFGGDVGAMLAAIGQKGPSGTPLYERVMPQDVYSLRGVVERHLGAAELPPYPREAGVRSPQFKAWRAARDRNTEIYYAAMSAYPYITAWEILGQEPEIKQVPSLGLLARIADGDLPRAWELLRDATRAALAEMPRDGFISPVTTQAADEFGVATDDYDDELDQSAGYESEPNPHPGRTPVLPSPPPAQRVPERRSGGLLKRLFRG